MRPFETYPGGKGADGVYQTIINHLPPHEVFISGCLGNCAVMRFKRPAALNIGIDADREVIDAWENQNNRRLAQKDSVLNKSHQLDLFHASFFDYAEKFFKPHDHPDTLVYLDPPYLKETRRDSKSDLYLHEFSQRDHERLLGLALSMRTRVVISC